MKMGARFVEMMVDAKSQKKYRYHSTQYAEKNRTSRPQGSILRIVQVRDIIRGRFVQDTAPYIIYRVWRIAVEGSAPLTVTSEQYLQQHLVILSGPGMGITWNGGGSDNYYAYLRK